MPPKGKARKRQRLIPSVGDYILINPGYGHISGAVMEVIQVLDRDRVIGKPVDDDENDFKLNQFVVFTKPPRNTKRNPNAEKYTWWVKQIIRVAPAPPKPVKPPKPVRVITTRDELTEHLTAPLDNSVHVVVALKEGGVDLDSSDDDSSDDPAPSALCAAVPPSEASAETGN